MEGKVYIEACRADRSSGGYNAVDLLDMLEWQLAQLGMSMNSQFVPVGGYMPSGIAVTQYLTEPPMEGVEKQIVAKINEGLTQLATSIKDTIGQTISNIHARRPVFALMDEVVSVEGPFGLGVTPILHVTEDGATLGGFRTVTSNGVDSWTADHPTLRAAWLFSGQAGVCPINIPLPSVTADEALVKTHTATLNEKLDDYYNTLKVSGDIFEKAKELPAVSTAGPQSATGATGAPNPKMVKNAALTRDEFRKQAWEGVMLAKHELQSCGAVIRHGKVWY